MEIAAFTRDEEPIAATTRDRQARVHLYRPEGTAVILGRGSKPEIELHDTYILADRIPVLRRRGGGCSVVLDPGQAVVSVYLPCEHLGGSKKAFGALSSWLIRALAELGITNVCQEGISDLVLHDRKIGGSCIYQTNRVIFYTTTLLVSPDLERVERYLAHPPREPTYRRGRSHRDFMSGIEDALTDPDVDRFIDALGGRLQHIGLPLIGEPEYQTVRWQIRGATVAPCRDASGEPRRVHSAWFVRVPSRV